MSALRIASGKTQPGQTDWRRGVDDRLWLMVDTSGAGFDTTPNYFVSIGGEIDYWKARGGHVVCEPKASSFVVRVWYAGRPIFTPADANTMRWHVNWMAFGSG